MAVNDYPFSDLLRHPKVVARDLADADVLLRRRDEPEIIMVSADRADVRSECFESLARIVRILEDAHPDALATALGEVYPWVEFLPSTDRGAFVDAFVRTVVAASSIGELVPVGRLTREWRATAAIGANSELASALQRSTSGDGDPVARPRA